MVNTYVKYLKLMCRNDHCRIDFWCYTDRFGPKTPIRILHFSRLTQLHDSNIILELFSSTEYVDKMNVCILKGILEQYEVSVARYTLFKSVTVTGTVTATHN